MNNQYTRGVLFIHSAPKVLCPHIEWAASAVLHTDISLDWTVQDLDSRFLRAESSWVGAVGTGAQLASALRGWEHLRYEVTDDAAPGTDGGRWMHTPDLGIFFAQTDSAGNVVVPEGRILAALEHAGDAAQMQRELDLALGRAWDRELEPYRWAGQGAPVKYLHRVG